MGGVPLGRSRSSTGLCRGARGAWRGVRRARWAPWPRPQHIPIGEKMLMVGSASGMREPMIHRGPLRSALCDACLQKVLAFSPFSHETRPPQTLSTRWRWGGGESRCSSCAPLSLTLRIASCCYFFRKAVGEPSEKFDNVTASLEVLDVEDHPWRGNRPGRDGSPANGPLSIRHSPDARVCSLSTPTPFTLSRSVALSLVVRVERLTAGCFSRPRAPLHHGAHHGAPHAPNGTLTARVPPLTMKVPTSLPDASISSFRCETKTVWPAARARTCSASARTL